MNTGEKPTTDKPICCDLCDAEMPDVTAAIEAGWSPSYYHADDDAEIDRPICGDCAAGRCRVDASGELVLKGSSHNYKRCDSAVESLKRAANQLYMIGTPEAVAWGEKIDALLGGGKDGRGPQPSGQGGLLEFLKSLE